MFEDIIEKRISSMQKMIGIAGERRRDRLELLKALAALMIALAAMTGAVIGLAKYLNTSDYPPGTIITIPPAKTHD